MSGLTWTSMHAGGDLDEDGAARMPLRPTATVPGLPEQRERDVEQLKTAPPIVEQAEGGLNTADTPLQGPNAAPLGRGLRGLPASSESKNAVEERELPDLLALAAKLRGGPAQRPDLSPVVLTAEEAKRYKGTFRDVSWYPTAADLIFELGAAGRREP